jgi:hypothetical protein
MRFDNAKKLNSSVNSFLRSASFPVLLATTQLAACNPMHEFFHRPVNVDKVDVRSSESVAKRPAATVAVDATRRVAVFNRAAYVLTMDDGLDASSKGTFAGGVHPVIVCAEPPPDTAVSTLSDVSGS